MIRAGFPDAISIMNLLSSLLALAGMLYLLVRRWHTDGYVSRLLILDAVGAVSLIVIVLGATFQAGILPEAVWLVLSFGGRIMILAGVVALLIQGIEYIPILDRQTSSAEKILAVARQEAVKILKEAADLAEEKLRIEADPVIRRDVARTADNTERMAESMEHQNGNSKGDRK